MIPLTISIVTANNKNLILDCLSSIYETTIGLEFEIYVVINNSSDDSEEVIRENFPEVKLLINKEKLGFTHNHNMVIRRAEGKYVLVLNDDTVMLDNALKAMVDFAEASPDVGILGCKILNADRSLQWSCGRSLSHKLEHFISGVLRPFIPFLPGQHFHSTQEVSWVTGACLLARVEAIRQVGCFDENIIIYFEDADWCYRMIQADWKVVFYPLAEIIHYHGQTRKQYLARDTFIMYQSRLYFFSKHHGLLANFLIRTITVVDAVFRYVLASVSSRDRSGQKEKLLNTYKRVFKMSLASKRSPVSWEP